MTWPALIGTALLPYITFRAVSFVIGQLSRRREVQERLAPLPRKEDRTPLNQRIRGYDLPAVQRFWGALALDPDLLPAEERSLRLDLVSPLLYGAALATSLLLAWRYRDRCFAFGWLLLPVVTYMLADWTENLAQLKQLRLFRQHGPQALQADGIQVASRATTVKLLFFIGSQILIWLLLCWKLCWK